MSIYDHPEAFDLAFSYRDVATQCDFIETRLEKFALCSERRVLDIACATASHLREMARRGYDVDGFDANPAMVDYARRQFENEGLAANLFVDDMRSFELEGPYGLAMNLLTTFNYLLEDDDVHRHLGAVARCLPAGAVYFVELNHPREKLRWGTSATNRWVVERGDVEVEVDWDYERRPPHPVTGISQGIARIVVRREGRETEHLLPEKVRIFTHDELHEIVEREGSFEIVRTQGDFKLGHGFDDTPRSWRLLATLRRKGAPE